jgi:hypothetical protein
MNRQMLLSWLWWAMKMPESDCLFFLDESIRFGDIHTRWHRRLVWFSDQAPRTQRHAMPPTPVSDEPHVLVINAV